MPGLAPEMRSEKPLQRSVLFPGRETDFREESAHQWLAVRPTDAKPVYLRREPYPRQLARRASGGGDRRYRKLF